MYPLCIKITLCINVRLLWRVPDPPLQIEGAPSPRHSECCWLSALSWVSVQELPSGKESHLTQGDTCSLGITWIQWVIFGEEYIEVLASKWDNSECSSQLQSFYGLGWGLCWEQPCFSLCLILFLSLFYRHGSRGSPRTKFLHTNFSISECISWEIQPTSL